MTPASAFGIFCRLIFENYLTDKWAKRLYTRKSDVRRREI